MVESYFHLQCLKTKLPTESFWFHNNSLDRIISIQLMFRSLVSFTFFLMLCELTCSNKCILFLGCCASVQGIEYGGTSCRDEFRSSSRKYWAGGCYLHPCRLKGLWRRLSSTDFTNIDQFVQINTCLLSRRVTQSFNCNTLQWSSSLVWSGYSGSLHKALNIVQFLQYMDFGVFLLKALFKVMGLLFAGNHLCQRSCIQTISKEDCTMFHHRRQWKWATSQQANGLDTQKLWWFWSSQEVR